MNSSFADIFTSGPLLNFQKISDATLQAKNGGLFHIHRFLLSKKSEFFKTMFFFSPNSKEFPLPSIESHILEQILVFLYTDEISIKIEHVPDLLIACDFLMLDDLFREISCYGMEDIDVPNSLPLVNAAWILNDQDLFQHCYRFVQLNFENAIKISSNKVGCLSLDLLKMLLAEKCLNISSEKIIWQSICAWIEEDLPVKLKFVPELLNHLNLENMDESLAENIIRHPIVNKNEHCYVINELRTDLTSHCILNCHMYLQCYPVFPREKARMPSLINVYASNEQFFMTFDEKFDSCQKICNLDFCPTELIILDHKIHLFGDHKNLVFSWDIVNNVRTSISPIFLSRISHLHHIAVLSNGTVYCLESINFNPLRLERSYRVHRYIPEIDEWDIVASPQPSCLHSFIICCDKLFIFGNIFPDGPAFYAERFTIIAQTYNSEANTWTEISLPTIQLLYRVRQYQNKLLFFGFHAKLVKEYHPETNLWSTHSELPFSYDSPRIQIISNILYIYDTRNTYYNEKSVPQSVFWDVQHRSWTVVQDYFPFYKFDKLLYSEINNEEIVKKIMMKRRSSNQKWMQNFCDF